MVADRVDERLGESLFGGGYVFAVERIVAADRAAEEVDSPRRKHRDRLA